MSMTLNWLSQIEAIEAAELLLESICWTKLREPKIHSHSPQLNLFQALEFHQIDIGKKIFSS